MEFLNKTPLDGDSELFQESNLYVAKRMVKSYGKEILEITAIRNSGSGLNNLSFLKT